MHISLIVTLGFALLGGCAATILGFVAFGILSLAVSDVNVVAASVGTGIGTAIGITLAISLIEILSGVFK